MYFVVFNNTTSKDLGIKVVKRPSIPVPERSYRITPVQGKCGDLYEDLGTYPDIEISIEMNFVEYNPNNFSEFSRKIKKWINFSDNKLKFSDDLSYFFIVKKTKISDFNRTFKKIGRFTLTFTCEPYMYLVDGAKERNLASLINNPYEVCRPIYKITGEGLLTLTINGINITANVGQNLIIDTGKGLCYRFDRTMNNAALTGKYKDLYLKEGNNIFTYTSGFDIKIVPNWRCI
ncbi:MAG: phage tail protein [Bacillota bacterium]|nr:phage tail protein [Bacillota bacterium]